MDATGIAVLRLLAAAPLTRSELASRVPGVELGGAVAALLRSRLVGRTVDPADRRRTLLTITPRGLARLDPVHPTRSRLAATGSGGQASGQE